MSIFPRGAAWSFRVCSLFSPSSRLATLGRGRSGGLRLDPLCLFPTRKLLMVAVTAPFPLGEGGGREREENSKKSTLLTCTAVTLCLLRYNSLAFIDNSSVYSCNSSFISFIYGDLDGWAGPLLAWAILYLLRRAVLKHILSPPLLRLQELDRPAGVFNFGNSYSLASLTPTHYYLPWLPCIQWGNSV